MAARNMTVTLSSGRVFSSNLGCLDIELPNNNDSPLILRFGDTITSYINPELITNNGLWTKGNIHYWQGAVFSNAVESDKDVGGTPPVPGFGNTWNAPTANMPTDSTATTVLQIEILGTNTGLYNFLTVKNMSQANTLATPITPIRYDVNWQGSPVAKPDNRYSIDFFGFGQAAGNARGRFNDGRYGSSFPIDTNPQTVSSVNMVAYVWPNTNISDITANDPSAQYASGQRVFFSWSITGVPSGFTTQVTVKFGVADNPSSSTGSWVTMDNVTQASEGFVNVDITYGGYKASIDSPVRNKSFQFTVFPKGGASTQPDIEIPEGTYGIITRDASNRQGMTTATEVITRLRAYKNTSGDGQQESDGSGPENSYPTPSGSNGNNSFLVWQGRGGGSSQADAIPPACWVDGTTQKTAKSNGNRDGLVSLLQIRDDAGVGKADYGIVIKNTTYGEFMLDSASVAYGVTKMYNCESLGGAWLDGNYSNKTANYLYKEITLTEPIPRQEGAPLLAVNSSKNDFLFAPQAIHNPNNNTYEKFRVFKLKGTTGNITVAQLTSSQEVLPPLDQGSYGIEIYTDESKIVWTSRWRCVMVSDVVPCRFETPGGPTTKGQYDLRTGYDGVIPPSKSSGTIEEVTPVGVEEPVNTRPLNPAKTYLLGGAHSGEVWYNPGSSGGSKAGGGYFRPCIRINSTTNVTRAMIRIENTTGDANATRQGQSFHPEGNFVLLKID
mgnify:CR=1 FL=1